METSILTNESSTRKMSWTAVVAGAAIALSVEITLNFLGMGLGFTSLDLSTDKLFKVGTGSIIWLAISGIISMWFGGWVAGKVSNYSCIKTRMLNGLLAWSFATLITVAVTTTTAGAMISGFSGIVKSSVSSVSQNELPSSDKQQPTNSLSSSDKVTNDDTAEESSNAVNKATNNLGSASIIIFIAFILSAISAMMGSFWSMPKRNKLEIH